MARSGRCARAREVSLVTSRVRRSWRWRRRSSARSTRASAAARRGRHRHRQDARVPRAALLCGQARGRLDRRPRRCRTRSCSATCRCSQQHLAVAVSRGAHEGPGNYLCLRRYEEFGGSAERADGAMRARTLPLFEDCWSTRRDRRSRRARELPEDAADLGARSAAARTRASAQRCRTTSACFVTRMRRARREARDRRRQSPPVLRRPGAARPAPARRRASPTTTR